MSSNDQRRQHRLDTLGRLRGLTFQFAEYTAPSTDWDHDHCEGCWRKFASFDAPDILHKGYFTADATGKKSGEEAEVLKQARERGQKIIAKPDKKKWVCTDCFEEFRYPLGRNLKS